MNNNNSPKESDFPLKQEGHNSSDHEKAKASSASQWLRLKDPRIVRVSRAFGGKDRHSKVCTIRGLRDRRVRLSVPTAIQLYDLQDRLGLNQPSKVVDWLLNAAKHEIDELPPLPNIIPIPGNNFTLHGFPSSMITSNNNNEEASTSSHQPSDQNFNNYLNRSSIIQWEGSGSGSNSKAKEDSEEMVTEEEEDKQGISNNNLLPLRPSNHHHPSFLGLLNSMPIGTNYQQWEHNSSHHHDVNHAQLGNHGFGNNNQTDLHHSVNVVPFPSTLSLSTGNVPQVLLCPPGSSSTTQAYFPSHVTTTSSMDMDPRQISSHYQMLGSSSFGPFSLSMMTPKILHSPNSRESPSHKNHDFSTK